MRSAIIFLSMKKEQEIDRDIVDLIIKEGEDILLSKNMIKESSFPMHKRVSTYDHSLGVAYISVYFIKKHHIKNVDIRSVIRGALLHDFFLYDWHIHDKSHKFHGFIHARRALNNAEKEFNLNPIEKDIILKHMFPVNLKLPKYKESFIVNYADKVCASYELRYSRAEKAVSPIKSMFLTRHPSIKLA